MMTARKLAVAAGITALAVGAVALTIAYPGVVAVGVVALCLAGSMADQAHAERQNRRNRQGKDAGAPSREQTEAQLVAQYAYLNCDQDTGEGRFRERVSAEPEWDRGR